MKRCKNRGSSRVTRWVLERFEMGKKMNSQKCSREKLKTFKTDLYVQNTRFLWLSQVAKKSPGPVARTLKTKILKNFSKCFSELEVLPVRESRDKPRKSLSLLATGPSTREQVARSWETLKTQILKNILSIFCNWGIDPSVSHEKSLCGLTIEIGRAHVWTPVT